MKPPLCPANYFGKGENYDLPTDPDLLKQFETDFDQWVSEHPDDPTGEKVIELYKESQKLERDKPKFVKIPPLKIGKNTEIPFAGFSPTPIYDPNNPPTEIQQIDPDVYETDQLKLQLPIQSINKLKKFATAKRRRPRDIIIAWIEKHATFENV